MKIINKQISKFLKEINKERETLAGEVIQEEEEKEIMAEVKEHNKEYNRLTEETIKEMQDGTQEMKEHNKQRTQQKRELTEDEVEFMKGFEESQKVKKALVGIQLHFNNRIDKIQRINEYFAIRFKIREELKLLQPSYNWKNIQELLRCSRIKCLKAIRTKVNFCKIINTTNNEILFEGAISEVLKEFNKLINDLIMQYI